MKILFLETVSNELLKKVLDELKFKGLLDVFSSARGFTSYNGSDETAISFVLKELESKESYDGSDFLSEGIDRRAIPWGHLYKFIIDSEEEAMVVVLKKEHLPRLFVEFEFWDELYVADKPIFTRLISN